MLVWILLFITFLIERYLSVKHTMMFFKVLKEHYTCKGSGQNARVDIEVPELSYYFG